MKITQAEILSNERGSALVIALLILALITMIGVSALSTSRVETTVAGNDRNYKSIWYDVEGTAMAALQTMQNLNDDPTKPLKDNPSLWLADGADVVLAATGNAPIDGMFTVADRLAADNYLFQTWTPNAGAGTNNAEFFVVYEGVEGSLDVTKPGRDRLYSVYGRRSTASERIMIKSRFKGHW